jgi:hypothetical protein
MSPRRALLAAFTLVVLGLVWFLWPRHSAEEHNPAATLTRSSSAQSALRNPQSAIAPPPAEVSRLADPLNSPAGDIRADLRVVLDLVEGFRTNFPKDGNPTGTNAEITAALAGRNKLRLALIPPNHPAINRDGELCDRWGTPFFFHSESATRMEVRSAGPDKKMWTEDDVVLTP